MADPFDLARFVTAQRPVIEQVRRELQAGRKQTHWMWFVFPQLRGLGRSETARRFGITGLEEARAYLAHPVLGARLVDLAGIVNTTEEKTLNGILGSPDDLKFHSCVTLFRAADPELPVFREALRIWFDGRPDEATEALLDPAKAAARTKAKPDAEPPEAAAAATAEPPDSGTEATPAVPKPPTVP